MYIITGVSRGLGKAIVDALLKNNERVVGIGRSNPFGDRIEFMECDLNNPKAITSPEFNGMDEAVTLINNAGILGDIGRISAKTESDLERVMQVNVFAPMTLTRNVYAKVNDKNQFRLVNISSGAANRSIPSWAAYCASKAALNRLTENFYLEEKELGHNVQAYAVAPGVIDTGMQQEIRSVSEDQFSGVQNFVQMKENGSLYSPEEAATRLLQLLKQPFNGEVFQDLRNLKP